MLLTHSHGDHSDGVGMLDVEPAEARGWGGPRGIAVVATPGHAADHLSFLLPRATPPRATPRGTICFAGDLILGEGSSIVPPRAQGGSMGDYLASLDKLAALDLELIYPGHGPVVAGPRGEDRRVHRAPHLARAAADRGTRRGGERSRMRLLEIVWDDVGAELRPMAAYAMQAHLEKLDDDGVLPGDLTE